MPYKEEDLEFITSQPATASQISTALFSVTQLGLHGYTSPDSSSLIGLDNFILRVVQP